MLALLWEAERRALLYGIHRSAEFTAQPIDDL